MKTPIAAAVLAVGLGPAALADDFWRLPVPGQGEPPEQAVELTKDLDAATCGLCHPRQFAEWQGSLHARAVGAGLRGQLVVLDRAAAADCLRCHAPRSEQQQKILADPVAGGAGGVDCAGCHVRAHRRFGPDPKPITPHGAVGALPLFRESRFCSPCHQFPDGIGELAGKPLENTEREWAASRYAAAGISCQRCHMPGGNHAFKGIHDPELVRRALTLSLRRDAEGAVLEAMNSGAGHALPTYATPRIRLRLQAVGDPAAVVRHDIQRRLAWDPAGGLTEQSDTRLMPDESIVLQLDLGPEQSALAEILVEPDAFYHEVVYPTLLETLADSDRRAEVRRLLVQARQAAAASGFVVYRALCDRWAGRVKDCSELSSTGPHPEGVRE